MINRITDLVEDSGLTNCAFARKVGIDASAFSKKIKGISTITKKDISLISTALGVQYEWLLTGEGEKTGSIIYNTDAPDSPESDTSVSRFKMYLNSKGITNARAEKECGFSNGLIGNALRTNSTIGSDKLEKILNVYPDMSAEWLLRGRGKMILGQDKSREIYARIAQIASGERNQDKAYDVILAIIDMVGKIYEFFYNKNKNSEQIVVEK